MVIAGIVIILYAVSASLSMHLPRTAEFSIGYFLFFTGLLVGFRNNILFGLFISSISTICFWGIVSFVVL